MEENHECEEQTASDDLHFFCTEPKKKEMLATSIFTDIGYTLLPNLFYEIQTGRRNIALILDFNTGVFNNFISQSSEFTFTLKQII